MGEKKQQCDHFRSFTYASDECEWKLGVPWNGCSWTQHICGQQTAGSRKRFFRAALGKKKTVVRASQTPRSRPHTQHCVCLDGHVSVRAGIMCFMLPVLPHEEADLQTCLGSGTPRTPPWPRCWGRLSPGTWSDTRCLWRGTRRMQCKVEHHIYWTVTNAWVMLIYCTD